MENFLEQSAEQLVISKVLSINFPNFNKGCFMNSIDIFIYKKTFDWKENEIGKQNFLTKNQLFIKPNHTQQLHDY